VVFARCWPLGRAHLAEEPKFPSVMRCLYREAYHSTLVGALLSVMAFCLSVRKAQDTSVWFRHRLSGEETIQETPGQGQYEVLSILSCCKTYLLGLTVRYIDRSGVVGGVRNVGRTVCVSSRSL